MKIRSLIFTAAFVMLSSLLYSQKKKAASTVPVSLGFRAGINFQNINGRDFFDDKLENKLVARFHAGVNAELMLAPEFYIQPGVLLSTKGMKEKVTDSKFNISYIEIPVNLLYKPELGDGKLLLGFGPYIAFGVGGKEKRTNGNDLTIQYEKSISAGQALSATPYFRRFDAGGNLLVGYELSNNLSVQLNAQLGLTNINPEIDGVSNDKTRYRNTGFGLSAGYRLGR
jgi:hypothetical protein